MSGVIVEEQKLPTKEILRVLWPFLKANKKFLISTVVLMTLSSIANVFIPMLGKDLIEGKHTTANKIAGGTEAALDRVAELKSANAYHITSRAATMIATFITYHSVSCWGHLQAYKLGMHMSTDMIKKAVEGLAVVPWEDTIRQNPAEYSQTLVQASRYAGDTIASILTNMYPNLIGVVGFAVMVLYMSPSLTLLFALVVVVTQSLQRYRQRKIDLNSASVAQQEAKTLAVVTNTIQRSALIRLFDCSDFILSKLDECARRSMDSAGNLNFAIHSNAAMGSGATNCLFVLIVALMLLQRNEAEDAFSTLDIAMFFMIMGQLLSRVVSVVNDINQMNTMVQRTVPFVKLMRRAESNGLIPFSVDETVTTTTIGGPRNAIHSTVSSTTSLEGVRGELSSTDMLQRKQRGDIVVELKDVGFVYGGVTSSTSDHPSSGGSTSSLRNISLSIRKGDFVGIVGASGGGKTTVLRIIAGLLKATSGSVKVLEDVCMLEQGASIVVGSVEENILIGNRKMITTTQRRKVKNSDATDTDTSSSSASVVNENVRNAAEMSGSLGFITQLPAGFKTLLENIDVSGFSGGQLQRICLARVFLSSANIVLFDEPTTGLDPISAARFFESAMRLRESGRTIILVTHEHHLVAGADMVVAVKAGEIVGQGSYTDLKPLLATLHDHESIES